MGVMVSQGSLRMQAGLGSWWAGPRRCHSFSPHTSGNFSNQFRSWFCQKKNFILAWLPPRVLRKNFILTLHLHRALRLALAWLVSPSAASAPTKRQSGGREREGIGTAAFFLLRR